MHTKALFSFETFVII